MFTLFSVQRRSQNHFVSESYKKPPEQSIPPHRDRFSRRYHPCSYMRHTSFSQSAIVRPNQCLLSHIYTRFALNADATLCFAPTGARTKLQGRFRDSSPKISQHRSPLCKARMFRTIPLLCFFYIGLCPASAYFITAERGLSTSISVCNTYITRKLKYASKQSYGSHPCLFLSNTINLTLTYIILQRRSRIYGKGTCLFYYI